MTQEEIINRLNSASVAIKAVFELLESVVLRENELKDQAGELQRQRDALISEKNELLSSTKAHRGEIDKSNQMRITAQKMKDSVAEDLESIKVKEMELSKREKAVKDLEDKNKVLDARERELKIKELDLEERETEATRDKLHAREKLEEVEIREKKLIAREKRVQAMLTI